MNPKIAILRGINVGGRRRILMADLKLLLKNLGFQNLKTYIQSGNVLFDTNESLTNIEIADRMEKAILDKYGFVVPVVVIDAKNLEELVENNPFYKQKEVDITRLHLTFLKEKPSQDNYLKATSYSFEPDKFVIQDKAVFIFCAGKYHQSKLTNTFFEKKLQVAASTRNWKTVLKLVALSQT